MTTTTHEKCALHTAQLGGKDSEKGASTTTHEGVEDMTQTTTIPARFKQVHDGEDIHFVANELRGTWFDAEEVILPHSGNGLDPLYNLTGGVEEGNIWELEEALVEALEWVHKIKAQLPNGTELNR